MGDGQRAIAWAGLVLGTLLAGIGTARADSLALVSGAGQSGLIGQPAAQPIVVVARNVNGVAVSGRTIHWSTGNGFQLSAATSVTDANGQASIGFNYGNYGTANITASDPTGGTTATATATSVGSDSLVVISGSGQAGQQNTSSAQPIVVELRNAAGVPISGRTIQWSDQTSYTQVASATSVTNASGQAGMGFTYLQGPAAAGGAIATIRATNSTGPQYAEASATVLGFDIVRLVSVQSQSGLVGSAGAPVTVRVTDWTGSTPRAGVTVVWSERLSTGLVALSSSSTVTDANGQTSIGFQYLLPGSGEITAEYGLSATDMSFVSVGGDHMVLISPNNTYGAPGSPAVAPIVAEVRNGNNQPIAGRTIQWVTLMGDAVADSPTSVSNASGQVTMGFTHGTVLSAIAARDPLIPNPDPAFPNFAREVDTWSNPTNPANQNTMRLVSGSGQTGLAGTAAAQPLVVEVLDSGGAPVVGLEIFYSISGSVVLDPAPTFTDANGRASKNFTYGGPGYSMIQAARNFGTPAGTAAYVQFHVTATGMDTIASISGDGQSGLTGSHSTQPLVAELRDASGQPVVGRTITWIVNSGAGTATFDAPTSVTGANGQASMGFTYSATASIAGLEARDTTTGVHIGYVATTVGADAVSLISGNGQVGMDGTNAPQPLEIEVRDAAGNVVSGRTINWSVATGSAALTSPSSVTNGAGRATMGFSFGNDASTIVATDAVTGRSAQFAVSGFEVQDTTKIISGDGQSGLPGTAGAQPIVLEMRDANNLPSPGVPVAWSVVSGPATLLSSTNATDGNGQSSATFNYGPSPGTSIIQAKDANNPNGQFVQATVTSLGNNQTLVILEGADQTLVAGTPSAPLVVQLKDFANQPVQGATVQWTATNGALTGASTTTDADGKTSNVVTPDSDGPVEVQASSQLAASAVTFALNTSIAELPNLSPKEQAVAVAVDNLCPALASQSSLSPEQADLLARCQELTAAAGLDPNATADALSELLTDTAQAQSSAAVAAVAAQVLNIRTRLMALRSSSPTSSLAGLSFTAAGGTLAMPSLLKALSEDAPEGGSMPLGQGRWGFFASGNIGRGENDGSRSSPAFDYDIEGLTAGVDYRFSDDLVAGVAAGYTRQDTDLEQDQGKIALRGWSLSAYGTRSFKGKWYVDGVVTGGRNAYTLQRRIEYTLPTAGGGTTSIDQLAVGKPGGDLFSAALTFGGDFNHQSLTISPYAQVVWSRVSFDAYDERLRSGPGHGLGLTVEEREITGLTGIVGTRLSWAFSAEWGVWVPTVMLEWNHEFREELDGITAHFTHDPTRTLISVGGQPTDADYMRFGVGLSIVLAHGRSGFFLYDRTVAQDGQSQENLSIGIRIEF